MLRCLNDYCASLKRLPRNTNISPCFVTFHFIGCPRLQIWERITVNFSFLAPPIKERFDSDLDVLLGGLALDSLNTQIKSSFKALGRTFHNDALKRDHIT